MNIEEFADLLTCHSGLPVEALEALAEYAGIGFCSLNLKTGEIDLNNTITKLTGFAPGELPHTEASKTMLTFEDDVDIVKHAMASLMNGEASRYYIEFRMKRRDGSLVAVGEHALVLERDENGRPVHICTLDQDLSRLRWAEGKARRMERENRTLAEQASPTTLANRNRMLQATNVAATMIISGYHHEYETVLKQALQILAESIGADKAYILRNTSRAGVIRFFMRSIWEKNKTISPGNSDSSLIYDEYFPNWKKDFSGHFSIRSKVCDLPSPLNALAWLGKDNAVLLAPLYIQGEFFGMLGFEKPAEEGGFSEDEADVMVAGTLVVASSIMRNETFVKLNEAKEEAVSGTKAKAEFLSRMSHEIRTPINAIIGMSTLAKRTDDPDAIRHYLDMIDISSKQLLSLINDVLDMSKIDSGKFEIQKEPFELGAMLEGVVQVIKVKCDEKEQSLIVNAPEEIFERQLLGDELRLTQVLINLLSNASKFTPENGTITLAASTCAQGTRLRLSVTDTGIGISKENQKNLFQVFEQADGSITRNYGGSGLGLSICKKIVDLMGGRIWVDSEAGQGAVFTFEIPVEWGDAVRKSAAAESLGRDSDLSENAPDWSGKTILLAEDIEINREIVAGMLSDTGVKIVFAEDGQQALELFRESPGGFDLILMDMQMPRMDGLTATRLIREEGLAPRIPILAMTANAFREDVEACLSAGMDAHIAKPINMEELLCVIETHFFENCPAGMAE